MQCLRTMVIPLLRRVDVSQFSTKSIVEIVCLPLLSGDTWTVTDSGADSGDPDSNPSQSINSLGGGVY